MLLQCFDMFLGQRNICDLQIWLGLLSQLDKCHVEQSFLIMRVQGCMDNSKSPRGHVLVQDCQIAHKVSPKGVMASIVDRFFQLGAAFLGLGKRAALFLTVVSFAVAPGQNNIHKQEVVSCVLVPSCIWYQLAPQSNLDTILICQRLADASVHSKNALPKKVDSKPRRQTVSYGRLLFWLCWLLG